MKRSSHITANVSPDSLSVSVLFLLRFYITLVGCFALAKVIFIAYNSACDTTFTFADAVMAILHGLPLDMATAGYFAAPLWLGLLVGLWWRTKARHILFKGYCVIIALLIAACLVADTGLYEFWGIKLDGTVFTYLESPEGAMNSVSTAYIVGAGLAYVAYTLILYFALSHVMPREWGKNVRLKAKGEGVKCPLKRTKTFFKKSLTFLKFQNGFFEKGKGLFLRPLIMLLLGGLLFLGIRGGVGKSTANVGMVYHSDNLFMNHSAVNPVFSIVASLFKTKDFAEQYDYFDEAERARLFSQMEYHTSGNPIDTLLHTSRPNVLLILMEGCSGVFVHAIDSTARPDITPRLNQLATEGVLFTQCYANSFRTDRGTVCTLSGYPAFPDVSVMKVPSKCERLPSIAQALAGEGYSTEFVYGGDINFTNTNGYLRATGYERTLGDKDFPAVVRRTHNWGVTDHIVLDTLYQRILRYPADRPWHTACLTLSSHEPWKVPYDRIPEDEVLNAMAYLDHAIGQFIDRLRQTSVWENTLVILIPDHGAHYPQGISDASPTKSHIPVIWTGGAVRQARRIETLCNQTDLAATLLGQLGIDHSAFTFSRDVLADTYVRPSAIHVWSEGIYYMDETGISALSLVSQKKSILHEAPTPSVDRQQAAHAYLQTAYDDLGGL
ncbi:MAG: LTA synthase family protein [Bacteroidaceae bacterium]|nr:LTA synthase family protein [Bacteroidaceae bacterium]